MQRAKIRSVLSSLVDEGRRLKLTCPRGEACRQVCDETPVSHLNCSSVCCQPVFDSVTLSSALDRKVTGGNSSVGSVAMLYKDK